MKKRVEARVRSYCSWEAGQTRHFCSTVLQIIGIATYSKTEPVAVEADATKQKAKSRHVCSIATATVETGSVFYVEIQNIFLTVYDMFSCMFK